jgi:hypothetical protein
MSNELDSFLGDLKEDNNNPFNETETTTEKEVEKEAEEEPKEEKPLPFNKDPKVQRYIERQVAKALEGRGSVEKEFVHETKGDEDDYYARLIGNDTPEKLAMIKEAKARDEKLLTQAEERAYNRLTQSQQEEVQAERQAEEELETALDEIEEKFDIDITSNEPVAKKTRVDFLKFVERIAPKNGDGEITEYPDMMEAYETFKDMKSKPSSASKAKDISSRSMGRSGDSATTEKKTMSWRDVDRMFDKLG